MMMTITMTMITMSTYVQLGGKESRRESLAECLLLLLSARDEGRVCTAGIPCSRASVIIIIIIIIIIIAIRVKIYIVSFLWSRCDVVQ